MRYLLLVMAFFAMLSCSPEAVESNPTSDSQVGNATYYISNSGNDENDGLTIETAWKTVAPVNSMVVHPNTTFIFEGTFDQLFFDDLDQGATITSYGSTRSELKGISILNSSNYNINFIDVKEHGIKIENSMSNNQKISDFSINNVEVSNAWIGILIYGHHDTSGVSNVSIQNVEVHDCTEGGIYSQGYFSSTKVGYSHSNIHVYNTDVYNISGWDNPYSHSGSGIMLSDVQGSSIINSKAYSNGSQNTHCGGNVGIWYWDSKDVLIQGCESYNNRSLGCDGGGFDFDGGVVNGIMQYNYSHDNDGGGLMVGQFQGARRMENITLRYNVSENDNFTNGGSIYLFDYSGVADSMQDIYIYNNTLVQETRLTLKSTHNFDNDNVIVVNNIFTGNVSNTNWVTFLTNHVGPTAFIDGFKLPDNSSLIDAAVNLNWNIGDIDFYGNPSITGPIQDFGAVEYMGDLLGGI